jgi:hypothetical protein
VKKEFPILEFDPKTNAILNPQTEINAIAVPKRWVICFFQHAINKLNQQQRLTRLAVRKSVVGKHPICTLELKGQKIALHHAGVGAPLWAGVLEEVITRTAGSSTSVAVLRC